MMGVNRKNALVDFGSPALLACAVVELGKLGEERDVAGGFVRGEAEQLERARAQCRLRLRHDGVGDRFVAGTGGTTPKRNQVRM